MTDFKPVDEIKSAIAFLQGYKVVVLTGGDATTPSILPNVVSKKIDPVLMQVSAFDGDAVVLADTLRDITANCTVGSVSGDITAVTLSTTDPVLITSVAHGLSSGDTIRNVASIVGTVELNDSDYVIDVVSVDTFTLRFTRSSNYTAYTSGGTYDTPQRTLEFDADFTAYQLQVHLHRGV
jgi:hypothetical protein